VGLNSLKSFNLTNVYPNNKNKNKVKSKPLELYELAGKNGCSTCSNNIAPKLYMGEGGGGG
jgi:hypothetical protein